MNVGEQRTWHIFWCNYEAASTPTRMWCHTVPTLAHLFESKQLLKSKLKQGASESRESKQFSRQGDRIFCDFENSRVRPYKFSKQVRNTQILVKSSRSSPRIALHRTHIDCDRCLFLCLFLWLKSTCSHAPQLGCISPAP